MSKGELLKETDVLDYGEKYYVGDTLHYCDDEDLDFAGETVSTLRKELSINEDVEIRHFDSSVIYKDRDSLFEELRKDIN